MVSIQTMQAEADYSCNDYANWPGAWPNGYVVGETIRLAIANGAGMTIFSLDRGAFYTNPTRYGRLNVTDWELIRYLRQRDGEIPARSPSHLAKGRCKYAAYYERGDCPWCYYALNCLAA